MKLGSFSHSGFNLFKSKHFLSLNVWRVFSPSEKEMRSQITFFFSCSYKRNFSVFHRESRHFSQTHEVRGHCARASSLLRGYVPVAPPCRGCVGRPCCRDANWLLASLSSGLRSPSAPRGTDNRSPDERPQTLALPLRIMSEREEAVAMATPTTTICG